MSSPRTTLSLLVVLGVGLSVATGENRAGEHAKPLPYTLAVVVRAGERPGSRAVIEEFQEILRQRLEAARCFTEVLIEPGTDEAGADLIAEVSVHGYSEERTFDRSLASLHDPEKPPEDRAGETLEIGAKVEIRVLTAGDRAVVRQKRFERRLSHRAEAGGDARQEALDLWVAEVARTVGSFLCSGEERKWQSDIERSRGRTR